MTEMLDCLVTYTSALSHSEGVPSKYICYQIISGPGPTEGSGLAAIRVLVTNDPGEREVDHLLHAASCGGPHAAIAKALRYLEALHEGDNLQNLQTEIRSMPCVNVPDEVNHHLEVPRLQPGDLRVQMTISSGLTVLDARSPAVWEAPGVKIRGAVRIEPGHVPPDPKWPKDQLTVVYGCDAHDCQAAAVAAQLRKLGYGRCELLNGGLKLWQQVGGPVETK